MDSENYNKKILERYEGHHREWRWLQEARFRATVLAFAWFFAAYLIRLQDQSVLTGLLGSSKQGLISLAVVRILLVVIGVACTFFEVWKALRLEKRAEMVADHLANVLAAEGDQYPNELYERLTIARRPMYAFPTSGVALAMAIAAGTLLISQILAILEAVAGSTAD
jgi:hypothetical protein